MLNEIICFFIFCIILFLYLHIQYHFKTSNDLEIYEVDQITKERFEEICDLRQPLLFHNLEPFHKIVQNVNKDLLVKTYPVFDVKLRENKKNKPNTKEDQDQEESTELYVPLSLQLSNKLFEEDKSSNYFTESNYDFLKETGIVKHMSYNDEFLRPSLVSNCNYDILMGSEKSSTPFKYEINYRNYFMVTQGSIKIKLCPPVSEKYLYVENDYENFEFRSSINPWNVEEKYKNDFDKVKCLELELTPGKTFYIPAYWFYSIQFEKNSSVCSFKYRTYMNNMAIVPKLFMYTLQNQNIVRKVTKIKDDSLETNKIHEKINDISQNV